MSDEVVWVSLSHRSALSSVFHTRWMCRLPSRTLEDSGRVPTSRESAWLAGFSECAYCASGLETPDRMTRKQRAIARELTELHSE